MFCTRHRIFVDWGDPCPCCLENLDAPGAPHVRTLAACVDVDPSVCVTILVVEGDTHTRV